MKRWVRRGIAVAAAILVGLPLLLVGLYLFLSRANAELVSSGEVRKYLLYVPHSLDSSKPSPLVISLHGAWLYPGMQKRLTGWNAVAEEHGFIVVYPRATGFPRTWRLEPGARLNSEVRFFADLIDELSSRFNVDQSRIYINGYSNGAAMTIMLSCALSGRIAAIGVVATPIVSWDWCQEHRPLSMLIFHGTDDPFAPFRGGENSLTTAPLPPVEAWFAQWGERNRCDANAIDVDLAADVRLREYRNCADGASIRLYVLRGAGHIWPGGMKLPEFGTGPYTDSINATREMWARFQLHQLVREGH